MMFNFLIGLFSSLIIALAAYAKRSLSASGAIAAVILGTSVYYFGGIWFSAIMVAFFVSSTVLTKYKKYKKASSGEIVQKGGNRDFMQVFANGGVGLVFVILFYIYKSPLFLLLYSASFAESNSDTWASEIGVLSNSKPLSILTGKRLTNGISGGVSLLGTTFAFLGSSFIASFFAAAFLFLYGPDFKTMIYYSVLCLISGFCGSLIDSLLGASIQAQYYCSQTSSITEKSHFNNVPNKLTHGIAFFNNDMVNFFSNLISSSVLALFVYYF